MKLEVAHGLQLRFISKFSKSPMKKLSVLTTALLLGCCPGALAQVDAAQEPRTPATPAAVVPNLTMTGKVMSGYQGWFNTPSDGANRGWRHWAGSTPQPGNASIDMWPDMTETDPDERYATGFKHKDGRVAEVYSAHNEKTVMRHFKWMRDYGLDGVFLQRFAGEVSNESGRNHFNKVLSSARKGAQTYGRVYGMMYDLSGVQDGGAEGIIADWKSLYDETKLTKDDRYVRHNNKPVVVLWGLGFIEGGRPALLDDGLKIVNFLKNDPVYGGNVVMLGVPYTWRTTDNADVPFAKFEQLIRAADILSPWSVGRPNTPSAVIENAQRVLKPDLEWCQARGIEYMPVVFPGFTWFNLRKGTTPSNQIPRLGGKFLWTQYVEAKKVGATMVYQAMFDEVDEGTAIFKVTNDVPDGEGKSQFVPLEGLPSDFYLKLVGQATRLVRGDFKVEDDTLVKDAPWTPFMPELKPAPVNAGESAKMRALQTGERRGAVVVSSERDEQGSATKKFSVQGEWNYPGVWTSPGAGKRAIWEANLPEAGHYRVQIWYGDDPNQDHATNALVRVQHADGVHQTRLNLREPTGVWVTLGTFRFNKATAAKVTLEAANADGNLVADLVRFVRVK
jgi:hypothetical protein